MKYAYHIIESHSNSDLTSPVQFVRSVYDRLSQQTDFSPNNRSVNTELTALVHAVSKWEEQSLFRYADLRKEAPEVLDSLPDLCAKAECEMEKWWAEKLISGASDLTDFWYLDNYRNLVESELRLIGPAAAQKTMVFLGSGSLPLTAILYARKNTQANIVCVDSDSEACQLSIELVQSLGLSERIRIVETSAGQYNFEPDQLVMCASLLRAPDLYRRLYDHGVQSIVVRDAEGLYRILYSPAELPEQTRYIETRRTLVKSEHINTSRFYERFSR